MRFSLPGILNCGFLHGSVLKLVFIHNLKQCQRVVLICALTTVVFLRNIYFEKIEPALNKEISSIC